MVFIKYVDIAGCKFQLLLSLKIKLHAKIIITGRDAELISEEVANENRINAQESVCKTTVECIRQKKIQLVFQR